MNEIGQAICQQRPLWKWSQFESMATHDLVVGS